MCNGERDSRTIKVNEVWFARQPALKTLGSIDSMDLAQWQVIDARKTPYKYGVYRTFDGARVRAFHAWSLLDNFAWADRYSQRYDLTYVDFRDQKRVKDCGHWYGRVADTGRLNV